jgi:hypothetical protein
MRVMAHRVHKVARAEDATIIEIGLDKGIPEQIAYVWEEIGRARVALQDALRELEERVEELEKR